MRSKVRDRRPAHRRQGAFGLLVQTLALLLVGLLTAGHTLPSLHFATVAHEICAEHGELEHVDHRRGVASLGEERPAQPAVSGSAPVAEHEHDQCAVCTASAAGATIDRASAVLRLGPQHAERPSVVRDSVAKNGVPLLRYAPKLAPPVSAHS